VKFVTQTKFNPNQTKPSVIKPSNQSVTNSNVVVNDTALLLPDLLANSSYWVDIVLSVQGTVSAGGIRASFTLPAGALMQGCWVSSAVNNSVLIQNSNAVVTLVTAANMKAQQIVIGKFFVTIAATAGQLTLQWAQVTASASPTTVAAGSIMSLVKVI